MSSSVSSAGSTPAGDPAGPGSEQPTSTPTGLIAFAWALVGVPLAYGLYQTVRTAADLFG
jgi:hypothetical protein